MCLSAGVVLAGRIAVYTLTAVGAVVDVHKTWQVLLGPMVAASDSRSAGLVVMHDVLWCVVRVCMCVPSGA